MHLSTHWSDHWANKPLALSVRSRSGPNFRCMLMAVLSYTEIPLIRRLVLTGSNQIAKYCICHITIVLLIKLGLEITRNIQFDSLWAVEVQVSDFVSQHI